jgi:DNA-binding response OmpR family regulator
MVAMMQCIGRALDVPQDAAGLGRVEHGTGDASLEDARILIVDDDAKLAQVTARILERDGFRSLEVCGDSRRALTLMDRHAPDVLVLDVHMPQLDGFEVLREMRRIERIATTTSVLALSGDASPSVCQAMLASGADDFVVRPCRAAELTLRVRRLAQRVNALRGALGYISWLECRVRDLSAACEKQERS